MLKGYYIIFFILIAFLCGSCELKIKPFESDEDEDITVCRYDRLESEYLTTGGYSALQQMNTDYPTQTRTLIEDILKIGEVNDPQINTKFLAFFQDPILQTLISDAESQYANMDDINKLLNESFDRLQEHIPDLPIPQIYAQITALDQSIVVGDQYIGISLDKYLGEDYELYKKYNYSESQLKTMSRENIVPDCLNFYLLSLYPMTDFEASSQMDRDIHISKVMWVCNLAMDNAFFKSEYIDMIEKYMAKNKDVDIESLLKIEDYSVFL